MVAVKDKVTFVSLPRRGPMKFNKNKSDEAVRRKKYFKL